MSQQNDEVFLKNYAVGLTSLTDGLLQDELNYLRAVIEHSQTPTANFIAVLRERIRMAENEIERRFLS